MNQNDLRRTVRVIGIGNPARGDDSAGPTVIRMLQDGPPVAAELSVHIGDGAALIDAWGPEDQVILVDATRSRSPPGALIRLDATAESLPAAWGGGTSTHALGPAEAIELARAIGRLPGSLVVYGIEAAGFQPGSSLDPAVCQGAIEAADQIRAEVVKLRATKNA